MRIKKARIQNFKSIVDSGEINLEEKITAFIGKNEQGKTNFLRSLITLNRDYSYSSDDLCYGIDSDSQSLRNPIITLWFSLSKNDKKFFKKFNLKIEKYNFIKICKYFNNKYDISLSESLLSDGVPVSDEVRLQDRNKLSSNLKDFLKLNVRLIERKNEQKHIEYILSLENNKGGFSNIINHNPTLSATYYAIEILKDWNLLNKINKDIHITFILSQLDMRGFKNDLSQVITLESTFFALKCLENLIGLNLINREPLIDYVLALQNKDGGFSHKTKEGSTNIDSTIENTFYAVKILKLLNGLEDRNKFKIINFILKSQSPTGGFGSRPGMVEGIISSTYYASSALKELNAINNIDLAKHAAFIKGRIKENGGFADVNNNNIDEKSTFFAIMALDNFLGIDDFLVKRTTDYILSAQIESGGFSYPGKMQQMDSTFYSISIIDSFEAYSEEVVIKKIVSIIYNQKKDISALKEDLSEYSKSLKSKYFIQGDLGNLINQFSIDKDNAATVILEHLPNILYTDDRMDLLIDSLKIFEYINKKDKYKTITNFLTLSGIDIENLSKKKGQDRRRDYENASLKITDMLKESWKQAKIKINFWLDGDEIHFTVEDESGIAVPPTKRSDGFQWYLSFYINYMAGIRSDLRNSILLLDNPGLQLHPSGQKDLLSTLEQLSKENQIIYTTHSPYLIDVRDLEKVRIIEKEIEKGTIVKEKYYNSNLDSLKPLRDSLGFTLRDSLFISEKNILVEGPSDKYILEGFITYLNDSLCKDSSHLNIISPGGAKKIPYYALFMASEKLKFSVILDNDRAGNGTERELKQISHINEKQIIKLNQIIDKNNITIEDLINPDFYNLAVNKCYEELLKTKFNGKTINIGIGDYEEDKLVDKYKRLFHDNGLGGFDKIRVSLQIKEFLNSGLEKSKVGEDTIENFKKMFSLIQEGLSIE